MIYTSQIKRFPWPARTNGYQALSPDAFRIVLDRERARVDRDGDGKVFSLIIFEVKESPVSKDHMKQIAASLAKRIRMTDVLGWTEQGDLGLFLYNTDHKGALHVASLIQQGFMHSFRIDFDVHQYPENEVKIKDSRDDIPPDEDHGGQGDSTEQAGPPHVPTLPGKTLGHGSKRSAVHTGGRYRSPFLNGIPWWKRAVDIAGSAFGLVILLPLFVFIAAAIKASSPGPVFFKQERVGYGGKHFTCLKFRTMKQDADSGIHKKYLAGLINSASISDRAAQPMVKLTGDTRIIPFIGSALRATCLDEIPQLINVLKGDMSLIGPRPAIPYEVERYLQWYYRRFDTLPGLTGLWQVSGKNRLTFNQMMRLDIAYVRNCSLMLDIAILLTTPWVVLTQIRDVLKAR
jgi:lipopolysaccharide/colanic/teichoic acid biosynthesis glycosyltransferase